MIDIATESYFVSTDSNDFSTQDGKVIKVLSQSTLLAAVVAHLNITDASKDDVHLAELQQTVAAAGVMSTPALTVNEHAHTALDAFTLLENKSVVVYLCVCAMCWIYVVVTLLS
jgi:hypothetical protein